MAHSLWGLNFPELLCQLQVQVHMMHLNSNTGQSLLIHTLSPFGSLSHTTHPGFPPNLRVAVACKPPMANTKLLCSKSVNYFSPKHTFPISRVTNYSSSKALACNQFPQGINFHSSLPFALPRQQIISTVMFLKSTPFSISSYPSPNPRHSETVTA